MSRLVSKAEGFEVAYEAFQNINFNAFDFYTIKQSMVDYVKLYFPETFNDFIESSEFIALIELFAYLGEIMAYRYDVNAHENILDFAQRKQSVLRLAKFISYKASRNVPARGLVRIETISTSEKVYDSRGNDLSNRVIKWNDPNNPNWKDQFFLVLNRVLEQRFGTVSPNERKQVNDILYELYPIKNEPLDTNTIRYQTSVTGRNYSMELVSSRLTENGPQEARPENNARFNILYGTDGLGDGSQNTGFFIYTKQGTLTKETATFDGVLPNQSYELGKNNINQTDVWVNNVDADTGAIVDDGTSPSGRSGEWVEVDLANAQNIIFNTNPIRSKYEIETLEDDKVRIIFGDGEFSDIPAGTFDIWYRTSVNEEVYIPRTGVIGKSSSVNYRDSNNQRQTFSFTYSLVSSLQNSSPSEDIEQIRRNAPSVYYAQDRMVNGRDYNTFPLQDPSILKLRTVNRTFAGQSNYEQIKDASSTYQDVKMFGDDLALYYTDVESMVSAGSGVSSEALIQNTIEPLLGTIDVLVKHRVELPEVEFRREFTEYEREKIYEAMGSVQYPYPIGLVYQPSEPGYQYDYQWVPAINIDTSDVNENARWNILIDRSQDESNYVITYRGKHIVAESPTTRFYDNNGDTNRVLSLDSLNTNTDEMVILKANASSDPTRLLNSNIHLDIIDVERVQHGLPNAGLPNLKQATVITRDRNNDSIPDDIDLPNLMGINFNEPVDFDLGDVTIDLPASYITGYDDVEVVGGEDGGVVTWHQDGFELDLVVDHNSIIGQEGEIVLYNNLLNDIAVGDIIEIKHATYGQHNGLYRAKRVEFYDNRTHVHVETDINVADPKNWYPGIRTRIESPTTTTSGVVEVHGRATNRVVVSNGGPGGNKSVQVKMKPYVYFSRETILDEFKIVEPTNELVTRWVADEQHNLYKREYGRYGLNFLWMHRTDRYNLVDPSPTNINDMFVITRSYNSEYARWVSGEVANQPASPTPSQLRSTYTELLDNKMISDTVIMHPGKFKLIIGDKAKPELRAKIKVVRTPTRTLTDNQIKIRIVNIVNEFFNINKWEFGETFFYTELDTKIQTSMSSDISSTVLVPTHPQHRFGDLYQVFAAEDEIIRVDIGVEDIEIVESLNQTTLRQG